MAEVAGAAVAVATAVVKLGTFLHEQAGFLDVKTDVEKLGEELKWMQACLKDEENNQYANNLTQQWKSDVVDLFFKCEDVIHTFLVEVGEPKTPAVCLGVMASCCISYTSNPCISHKLKRQIEGLKTELNEISKRRKRYERNNNNNRQLMDLKRRTAYDINEHMVGQANTISLLTNQLTNGSSGRFVISICGIGGIGKTTLARKLYHNLQKQPFEVHAWIGVSQVYDHRVILLQLIKSMMNLFESDLDGLTDTQSMESCLCRFLSGRRFLVVMDDVREREAWTREAWESLKRALPNNNDLDSRVIITATNIKVPDDATVYMHKLEYLNKDESWELFRKKAFPNENHITLPDDIENLGKEMVDKCKGLPLAIVTLGSLLSTKSINDWTLIRDYLRMELEKDSMHINAVLSLCYIDLPDYLKPCFLYVGMFPKDFEIPISKLILLWVAEGFIKPENRSPESLAKSYFDELVGRSLFQRKGEDWIGSTFRVHDLVRDLAINKAKDIDRFSLYYDENQIYSSNDATLHRRLVTFQFGGLPSRYNNPCLRTLFMRSPEKDVHMDNHQNSYKLLRSVLMHYRLLKVIDIHVQVYMHQHLLPREIGGLILLRYLGLHLLTTKNPRLGDSLPMSELPDTIGNLKALQTLCVTYDVIQPCMALPNTMENLQSLKHLIGNFFVGDWIGKLNCLETLQEITYDQWCGIDTTNLVNLRHLSLTNVPELEVNYPARFYDNFQTTRKLQTFSLENKKEIGVASVRVSRIFEYCPEITHFKSCGINFENSGKLHEFATNLELLDVVYYKSPEEDPIPLFERLPELRALRLKYYNANAQKIVCSDNGFPRLQTLDIELGHNVTFSVAESGMPRLANLETNNSANFQAPKRLTDLIVRF